MGAADYQTQQRSEEFGRPVAVGVRQGRTPRQCGAKMIEPRPVALDPADDLTQARPSGKPPVQHPQKLTSGRQPAHPRVGPVLLHQRIELLPREVLQQLMKNAIVMAHGIDPPLVSGSFPNNPRPIGINAVRYVQQKTYRTAVGSSRPSTCLPGTALPVAMRECPD